MSKRIFSITCTTCQARLAIRSESVVGAILECPRCQSMVQVTPPPSWRPSEPPIAEPLPETASSVVPPPLDRVATELPTLELESGGPSSWKVFFISALSAVGIGAVIALAWFAFLRPEQKSVDVEPEPIAAATAEAISEQPTLPPKASVEETPVPSQSSEEELMAESDTVEERSESEPPPVESPPSLPEPAPDVTLEEPPVVQVQEKVDAEVQKLPPVYVDVAARLAQPLAGVELLDMPLGKAVELFAGMGALPITFDVESVTLLGVTPRDPVSIRLDAATLGEVLQKVVEQKGLAIAVENDQIVIAAPPDFRESMRTVRYTVNDLAGNEASWAALAEMVQKLVAPERWQRSGGQGTVELQDGVLVVHQSNDVHRRILIFCEKLRNARHLPLRSREDPERFSLATHAERGAKTLARPVTANFHAPAPLAEVLAFLADAARCDILIDHAALAAFETSGGVEASLAAEKLPLGKLLDELLRPVGLTYRVVDQNTLEVTTFEAADERFELEFYPCPKVGEEQEGAIVEKITSQVSPESWSKAGGGGEVVFDTQSRCFLVLQSQPIQVEVGRILHQP